MSTNAPRIAVLGLEHVHIFELVQRLEAAGAVMVAHHREGLLSEAYGAWKSQSESRSEKDILEDTTIDVVVLAGIPSERADVARKVLAHNKHVLSDKPGVTSRAQLECIKKELAGKPGRPWTVLFTERFENRAISFALDIVQKGKIGSIVSIEGVGPHSLYAAIRPEWFWDKCKTGGILVDLGSHQIDQFLTIVGDDKPVEILHASIKNSACPNHPSMEDYGVCLLRSGDTHGYHRVDYLTQEGLGSWGDVRLTIVGTQGTIEVRANIDLGGKPGGEHLFYVNEQGTQRIDVSGDSISWAHTYLDDVREGSENLMTQSHVVRVSEVTLEAQELAATKTESI